MHKIYKSMLGKFGEVCSRYSLRMSGANPVASVYGNSGALGLLPMEVPSSPQANPAPSVIHFFR